MILLYTVDALWDRWVLALDNKSDPGLRLKVPVRLNQAERENTRPIPRPSEVDPEYKYCKYASTPKVPDRPRVDDAAAAAAGSSDQFPVLSLDAHAL